MTNPRYAIHNETWKEQLSQIKSRIDHVTPVIVEGRLNRMVGLTLEAVGCQAVIGSRCLVKSQNDQPVEAEVVGFSGEKLFLMPTGNIRGIHPDATVIPTHQIYEAHVGDALLGRVLDGRGVPIDGKGPLVTTERRALTGEPVNPLDRKPINTPLDVGVRAINALFSVGRGQRMGLFAGSGVGRSIAIGLARAGAEVAIADIDEASHEGNLKLKIKCIEDFDKRLLGRVLKNLKEDVKIAVLPDHLTPIELKTHVVDPVPFLIYKPGMRKDKVVSLDEESCKKGSYGLLEGNNFIKEFLA